MVKKNAVLIASVVIAGAIVATYVLSGNMNMGVEGSGNSIQQPTASIPSNSTVVRIVANAGSNSFSPNPVEVKVGETVTWINDDSGRHTVTSKDGVFDSGMMGKGQSFSFTFDKAGEYPYFCSPHPGMVGTVVVTES
ncbi:MAG: cupredoxin family copper-binding protein [Thermoproteota archaeon]|jgi:plastocyanin|nr:cupredoxin family copper-binding protein [Thermoproteota archaeon]